MKNLKKLKEVGTLIVLFLIPTMLCWSQNVVPVGDSGSYAELVRI